MDPFLDLLLGHMFLAERAPDQVRGCAVFLMWRGFPRFNSHP